MDIALCVETIKIFMKYQLKTKLDKNRNDLLYEVQLHYQYDGTNLYVLPDRQCLAIVPL